MTAVVLLALLFQLHGRPSVPPPTPKPTIAQPRSGLTEVYHFPPLVKIDPNGVLVFEVTTSDAVKDSGGEPFRVWRMRVHDVPAPQNVPPNQSAKWSPEEIVVCPVAELIFSASAGPQHPLRVPAYVFKKGDVVAIESRPWYRVTAVYDWQHPLPIYHDFGEADYAELPPAIAAKAREQAAKEPLVLLPPWFIRSDIRVSCDDF